MGVRAMPLYAAPLELLTDASGSVSFGWVDAGASYARFSHGLSTGLGTAYANRLHALEHKRHRAPG